MRYIKHNISSVTLHINPIKSTYIFTSDHKLFGIFIKEQTLGIRVLCNKWLPFPADTQNLKHSIPDLGFILFTIKSTSKTLHTFRYLQALAAFSSHLHPQYTFLKGSNVKHLIFFTLGIWYRNSCSPDSEKQTTSLPLTHAIRSCVTQSSGKTLLSELGTTVVCTS